MKFWTPVIWHFWAWQPCLLARGRNCVPRRNLTQDNWENYSFSLASKKIWCGTELNLQIKRNSHVHTKLQGSRISRFLALSGQGGNYSCDVQCTMSPPVYTVSPTRTTAVFRMTKSKNLQEHIESDIFWRSKNPLFRFLRYDYTGLTKRAFEMQRYLEHMTWNFSSLWNRQNIWTSKYCTLELHYFYHLPRLRKVLLGNFLNGAW